MADRRKFEEIVTDLREAGQDDLAEELDKGYGTSTLREQAGKVPELEKDRDEWKAKVEKLERAPVREKAFREYGVDLEGLRPAERDALEAYDGELDAEKIGVFVERYDLPLIEAGQEQQSEAPPAAAGVVAAARQAPTRSAANTLRITPDDVRGWSATQVLEWSRDHPAEWSEVLQGKTITGIAPPVGTGSPRQTADVKAGREGVRA
jgi:hypothetical protein